MGPRIGFAVGGVAAIVSGAWPRSLGRQRDAGALAGVPRPRPDRRRGAIVPAPWSSVCSTASQCSRSSTATSTAGSWTRSRSCRPRSAPASKYTWATEHHFLTEYSHLSANEVFLGTCGRDVDDPSGVGHLQRHAAREPSGPYRRARRCSTISPRTLRVRHGRRGSSTTEQKGFGITVPTWREMFDEVVGEFRKMWRAEEYAGHDGTYFSMPPRNVLPKPYSDPHPPMWAAAGNLDVREGGAHGWACCASRSAGSRR